MIFAYLAPTELGVPFAGESVSFSNDSFLNQIKVIKIKLLNLKFYFKKIFTFFSSPKDPETTISRNPSPSDDGLKP